MQNDRLNLTIILAEKNPTKMLCSQRYWQNKEREIFEKLQISLATEHFLCTLVDEYSGMTVARTTLEETLTALILQFNFFWLR